MSTRVGLSTTRILEGALDLLDRDGLDAFSMRRLAAELGVGTMTIYGYFRSRDELLDALVDRGAQDIAQLVSEAERAEPWKPQMRALMVGLRERLAEHPAFVELRYRRTLQSPGALHITEAGMRILGDAGFSRRRAAEIYRILFVYTFGFSAFGPEHRAGADREETLAALGALPREQFPNLVDAIGEAAEVMADQTLYEVGLDALLDGLEQRGR